MVKSLKNKKQTHTLDIIDCDVADYSKILQKQKGLCDKRREGKIFDTVFIVEHKRVITLGARQSANILVVD